MFIHEARAQIVELRTLLESSGESLPTASRGVRFRKIAHDLRGAGGSYGFPIVTSARSQPMVAGGRLFVASENSEVHALDPKTGCTHWTFKAEAGVRTALVAGAYRTAAGANGFAVFFGDARANAYAVDANTGQQIWVRKVDEHRSAGITGAPYFRARDTALVAQGSSVSTPPSLRASRPAGNTTTQRSASNASLARSSVSRVFSRVRLASTHSTGMITSPSRAETRSASALAK